jgi:hypothetical protein
LEKSYGFFIHSRFLGFGLPNRNQPNVVATIGVGNNHEGAERVHADRHEPLLSLGRIIFDRQRQRVIQDTVAFGEGKPVFLEVRGVLPGVEA